MPRRMYSMIHFSALLSLHTSTSLAYILLGFSSPSLNFTPGKLNELHCNVQYLIILLSYNYVPTLHCKLYKSHQPHKPFFINHTKTAEQPLDAKNNMMLFSSQIVNFFLEFEARFEHFQALLRPLQRIGSPDEYFLRPINLNLYFMCIRRLFLNVQAAWLKRKEI